MSDKAQALLAAGLAQGLSPDEVFAAAEALLLSSPSRATLALPPAGADDTIAGVGQDQEAAPVPAAGPSAAPAASPDFARIGGLSRYDDLGLIRGMGNIKAFAVASSRSRAPRISASGSQG